MIRLTQDVGRGAANRPHDLAVVQAVLSQVSAERHGGGGALWPRAVDGRASPDLEAAIRKLLEREEIGHAQRIDTFGPSMTALQRGLPPDWRGLTGIEGTTAVACSARGGGRDGENAARLLTTRTLLPRAAAEALGALARAVFQSTGLILRADGHGLDRQGRLVQRLALADTRWVGPSGRLEDRAPFGQGRRIVEALHRSRPPGAIDWSTDTLPALFARPHPAQSVGAQGLSSDTALDGAILAVRTREAVVPDAGSIRPDAARLTRLRISPTGDPVADHMLGAAADWLERKRAGR